MLTALVLAVALSRGAPETPAPSPAPAAAASPGSGLAPGTSSDALPPAVAEVFSPSRRSLLRRDNRCDDARAEYDAFADGNGADLTRGVKALRGLERCATLQRVGNDWGDFLDYTWTAAAAVAYTLGERSGEPVAFQRALSDAKYVNGFQVGTSTTTVIKSRTTSGQDSATPLMDGKRQRTSTMRVMGNQAGQFGALATEIGALAQQSLDAPHAK